ncbi:hypothetical protein [Streptomyces sulphureus]|uniref:hypothetical protein n=1 Tax=Streptomyces sulphureus TaxID=47758 RepID=UPI000369DB66|nr:hypothetical protein [Streptomyces sulphureus]
MSVYQVSCPARVFFLREELTLLPEDGFGVESALWCVLERDHAGLHHTLTQCLRGTDSLPPRNLWTRWPAGRSHGPPRETLVLPSCDERFLEGTTQEERCSLPDGHEGRHSYEFGPPITKDDVLPEWMLRFFE